MKKSKFFGFLIIFVFAIIFYYSDEVSSGKDNIDGSEEVKKVVDGGEVLVHFIDVGQGDAIFIQSSKFTMLIDAGEKSYGDEVVSYIKNEGVEKLDYVIGTHPHSDHIGGLISVISEFEVGAIYMPKVVHTSKTYEEVINLISDKGLSVKSAKDGAVLYSDEEYHLEFLAPMFEEYANINNYSAVLKMVYGEVSFLFTGDIEEEVERELLDEVSANVVKVSHHGSKTSSSNSFVNAVSPKYAIISVGEENQYNLPDEQVVNMWESVGAEVYKTSEYGNIIVKCDGKEVELILESVYESNY